MAYREIFSNLKTTEKRTGIFAGRFLDVDTSDVPFNNLPNHRTWIIDFNTQKGNPHAFSGHRVGTQIREYTKPKTENQQYYLI